jgi:ankyrin repeat protein
VSDEQLEMVGYLLQCGANAEALDRWGRSPIDCALETKNVAILRLLEREQFATTGKLSLFDGNAQLKLPAGETEGMRRSVA